VPTEVQRWNRSAHKDHRVRRAPGGPGNVRAASFPGPRSYPDAERGRAASPLLGDEAQRIVRTTWEDPRSQTADVVMVPTPRRQYVGLPEPCIKRLIAEHLAQRARL